jgi:hypothetical protein
MRICREAFWPRTDSERPHRIARSRSIVEAGGPEILACALPALTALFLMRVQDYLYEQEQINVE